jgi:hypothetical protein
MIFMCKMYEPMNEKNFIRFSLLICRILNLWCCTIVLSQRMKYGHGNGQMNHENEMHIKIPQKPQSKVTP